LQKLEVESVERGRGYARLLRRAWYRLRAMGSAVLEPYEITQPQYLALLWITGHEGIIQGDLAVELDSDPNTMSAILRQLDKKKLVTRRKHPTDGRAMSLFATKRGRELVSIIRPQMDRLSGSMLALLPPGHEAAVAEWLEKLAQIRG
jgi:DNA-binding MarR family transcriptional regulator